MAKEEILRFASENSVTLESVFIPWSQSRNKGEKQPSLNWRITVKKDDRAILETDYSAGLAHAPSYRQRATLHSDSAVKWECENGFTARGESDMFHKGAAISPDICDVLTSLALDSDAIDYADYEDWAINLGYDPDSRKGEAIYRACLETALKLRAGLSDDRLEKLREAAQDY